MTGRIVLLACVLGCVGCGTTRQTDSARAATEMLLVSRAVDEAVEQMDFSPLAGKAVFVNSDYVDKSLVDRGYLISTVRQQLLAAGASSKKKTRTRSTSSNSAPGASARTGRRCSSGVRN